MKNIILFLVFFCIINLFLFVFIYFFSVNDQEFRLDDRVENIILGDSQTECAINDKLLSNTVNLSQSADNNMFTYCKLMRLIKENQQIKRVFLGYSYTNNTKYFDKYFYEISYLRFKVPKYFTILKFEQLYDLFLINFKAIIQISPSIIKHGFLNFIKTKNILNEGDFGSYLELPIRESSFKVKMINSSEFSDIQKEYLNDIVELCNDNKIEIILLSTPIYKSKNTFNKKLIKQVETYPKDNKIKYLNFSDIYSDQKLFYDGVHLNKMGANLFTKEFQLYLNGQ